jgi:Lrp/AsnC family transcriptional regulator for asnA, asnC and gidA
MDKLERNILNVLQENSRLSFRKIAERIGTTAATVSSRINDMEEKGIIRKYTVLLDFDQLHKITLLLTIDTDLSVIDAVQNQLSALKEVCCVLRVTGDFDLAVLVRCDSRKDAGTLLHTIHNIEGVRDIASQVVLETIKETLCVEV